MFLIQDGHQAHTCAEPAIRRGDAAGIIWSLGDQTPGGLDRLLVNSYADEAVQAIDPQLYVAPLEDANPKKLPEHGLFKVPMKPRDFSAPNLVSLVDRIIGFQASHRVTHLIAPTITVGSMADRSAEVSANLAYTSLAAWGKRGDDRPLLISVAIQHSVLDDPDNVDALLDELTAYECDGFYLLMELPSRSDPAHASVRLESALYIVYMLAKVNEYTVWVGYSGLSGFVYRAAGAQASAAGKWQKQNRWSPDHWLVSGGGRPPTPRIYLQSLLGSLVIDAELQRIAQQRTDATLLTELLNGACDLAFLRERRFGGPYDRSELAEQLFSVCGKLDSRITGSVEEDMRRILDDIATAEVYLRRIREVGVEVDQGSERNALTIWQTAITGLGNRLGMEFNSQD